jgi:hypothetical protein
MFFPPAPRVTGLQLEDRRQVHAALLTVRSSPTTGKTKFHLEQGLIASINQSLLR